MNILIVGEGRLARHRLAGTLAEQGHVILTADHADEAIHLCGQHSIDLIILGVLKPPMDGFRFRRELRGRPYLRRVPLIVLSRSGPDHDAAELAYELGISHLLDESLEARGTAPEVGRPRRFRGGGEREAAVPGESASELKASVERYRALVDAARDGIWRFEIEPPAPVDLDPEELVGLILERVRLVEVNPALAAQYGCAAADAIRGFRLDDLIAGEGCDPADAVRGFVRSGFRITGAENTARRRDGTSFAVLRDVFGIVEERRLVGGWGTQRDLMELTKMVGEIGGTGVIVPLPLPDATEEERKAA